MNRIRLWAVLSSIVMTSISVSSCKDDGADPINTSANFTFASGAYCKIPGSTGITVTFTNSSEHAATYVWDFGDGSDPSTEEDPIHYYSLPGTYSVELTVGAAQGSSPPTSKKIIDVVVVDPALSLPNLILGGGLEAEDEGTWTKIYSGHKNTAGEFQHVAGVFDSTSFPPAGGVGGGFNVKVPTDLAGEAGTIYYQQITLTAGIYKFSGDIRHDAENTTSTGRSFKNYFFEISLDTKQPMTNASIITFDFTARPIIIGFVSSTWVAHTMPANNVPWPATNGVMPQAVWFVPSPRAPTDPAYRPRMFETIADRNGVVTVAAGNYYVILKAGASGDGGFGPNGISIDNLRLVKLN